MGFLVRLLGCRVRGRGGVGVEVSHFLFAYDTIVFCEPFRTN